MSAMGEYEIEPIAGLPERLPDGERILWQGAPRWQALARGTFHVRALAIYFSVLLGWRGVSALSDGLSIGAAALAALWLLPLVVAALGVLALLAWFISKTTLYTITTKRVVMRFGIALPMTVNIPFRIIDSASLKTHADASGDLPLMLTGDDRIAYLALWPHVRPWCFARPQPMLRGVPDAVQVAEILSRALATSVGGIARQAATEEPADTIVKARARGGLAAGAR